MVSAKSKEVFDLKQQIFSLILVGTLLLSCTACSNNGEVSAEDVTPPPSASPILSSEEVLITLSDDGVTFASVGNGETGVHLGDEIIYYKDGTDETYGEGSESEKHSAEEAAAHTVVTITKPGTYRLTGHLSQGQIFVDLGEDAKTDPEAVVTLILDNVDVTCTVAPALLFYRVYECNTAWVAYDEGETEDYAASAEADTSAAGANVIIAAGSENNFNGSHVARIYKEGTTKKLHKYDGAFYSKMSMNIDGDSGDDSGVLNVVSDNEGMNSEMHLTINGGNIYINSQDDGINTNEDYVSVTTINGGSLWVEAGRGAEGDGIDSNGYLTINGGTICTMSNERTPDGGIDADSAITINGGTLYAFGTRNDAADNASKQPYMELSFASTLAKNSTVEVKDESGTLIWTSTIPQSCQAITLTSPDLKLDTVYHVYVNGTLQCYSGNHFGMMGGFGGGKRFEGTGMPEDFDPTQIQRPEIDQMPEGFDPSQMQRPDKGQIPENFDPSQTQRPDGMGGGRDQMGGMTAGNADGETDFILTETTKSFSGICDSAESGKTTVSFTVDGIERTQAGTVIGEIKSIIASVEDLDDSQIQITITDNPSEDYAESCLLSDGLESINDLLPEDAGQYMLTVAVISSNTTHTGASQFAFTVAETSAE